MRRRSGDPNRLLPVWLAVSLLINATIVAVAGVGLAGRDREPEDGLRLLLEARVVHAVDAQPPPEQVAPVTVEPPIRSAPRQSPSPRPRSLVPAHTGRILRPSRPSPTEAAAVRRHAPDGPEHAQQVSRRDEPAPPADPAALPERSSYAGVPAGDAVPVAADRYGERFGAGIPGAGRAGAGNASAQAGGGGAEVLKAQGRGSSFGVGGLPGGSGSGPGLGGTGGGIGVGGTGSGVGMPGSGGGVGIGGQGGSAPLPKRVAANTPLKPGVPAQIDVSNSASAVRRPGAGEGASGGAGVSKPPEQVKPEAPGPEPETKPQPTPQPQEPTQVDLSRFRSMVQSKVAAARNYPAEARRNEQSGSVKVSFSVGPSGQPAGVSVSQSSGYSALDAAAVRAVNSAAPFLPFPKNAKGSIRVNVTVNFRLN